MSIADRKQWSAGSRRERDALDAILASPELARAPRLRQFLDYICRMYFEGRADELKEYLIAVDALGRPEDFDHTKDSIVRVEALRLRKKLQQYYRGSGAETKLRIEIPQGGYAPVFVDSSERVAAPLTHASRRRAWLGLVSAIVALLALAPAIRHITVPNPVSAVSDQQRADVRMLAGRPQGGVVDELGRFWTPARYVTGGQVAQRPIAQDQRLAPVYSQARVGAFYYDLPLSEGEYRLTLHFAELDDSDEAIARRFRVLADGRELLDDYNIWDDCSNEQGVSTRAFEPVTPGPDGVLRVEFQPIVGEALVSGIEITPGGPERSVHRILAGRSANVHDAAGNLWLADQYFFGGLTTQRTQRVEQTDRPNLFAGERYGDFTYEIPVPAGEYELRLHFAETWFGDANPGPGALGARRFDVFLGDEPLLADIDILREAGAENRAIVKTFRNIRPDRRGKVTLHFVSHQNFAMVNAIELERTSTAPARPTD